MTRDAAWVTALRAGGGAICYDWQRRRGVLAVAPDGDLPTVEEVLALFERLDSLCLKVVVVDGDGVLASYEREVLPWWHGLDDGPSH